MYDKANEPKQECKSVMAAVNENLDGIQVMAIKAKVIAKAIGFEPTPKGESKGPCLSGLQYVLYQQKMAIEELEQILNVTMNLLGVNDPVSDAMPSTAPSRIGR